jgi:peptidyl-prolyl cis-trans isomerase A (cyclophilin A)
MKRRIPGLLGLCILAASVVACVPAATAAQGQTAAPTPATTPKPATTAHSTTPRTTSMTTDPALLHPATLTAKAPAEYDVKFATSKGDVIIHVTRSWAPVGADRLYNLVKHGYFTDAPFFRVVPGFMIQFGISADPAVNAAWKNTNLKDDPVTQSNKPGYLTFATAGPNTRTTQLFINFGSNAFLDGQGFAPLGQVTTGMDIVQSLYAGYGEQPDQGMLTSMGKAYVDKSFPKLDVIKTASIVAPAAAPSAPAH